jgi:hypothetical protein
MTHEITTTDGATVVVVRRDPDAQCRVNFRNGDAPGHTLIIDTKDGLSLTTPDILERINFLQALPDSFPTSDKLERSGKIGDRTYSVTNGVMSLPDGSWISD